MNAEIFDTCARNCEDVLCKVRDILKFFVEYQSKGMPSVGVTSSRELNFDNETDRELCADAVIYCRKLQNNLSLVDVAIDEIGKAIEELFNCY